MTITISAPSSLAALIAACTAVTVVFAMTIRLQAVRVQIAGDEGGEEEEEQTNKFNKN